MVAQQHKRLVAQISHQSPALLKVQRQTFIAVVGDLMLQKAGVLADGQQAFGLRRHPDPGHGVQVDDVVRVFARAVDGRMDGETRRIDEAGRVLNDVSVQIDLHQTGGRHFLEIPAVRVDEEMMLRPRHARRDVGEDHVVPPVQRDQTVKGGQLDPSVPFPLGDPGLQGNSGTVGHRFDPHSSRRRKLAPHGAAVKIQLPLTAS